MCDVLTTTILITVVSLVKKWITHLSYHVYAFIVIYHQGKEYFLSLLIYLLIIGYQFYSDTVKGNHVSLHSNFEKKNWAVFKAAFTSGLYFLLSRKQAAMPACKEFAAGTYSETIPALRTFQIEVGMRTIYTF